jgi:hypothetical protein
VALIGLGIGSWLAPALSAKGYGLPTNEPAALAYLRAAGARDFVFGLIVLALGGAGARPLLAVTFASLTLVAVADFTLVYRACRPQVPPALIVHGLGTAGLPVVAIVIAAGW